jgi:hypothetical protein
MDLMGAKTFRKNSFEARQRNQLRYHSNSFFNSVICCFLPILVLFPEDRTSLTQSAIIMKVLVTIKC